MAPATLRESSWILFCTALLISATASAHKPSDSYLSLRVTDKQVAGQWDIALRDLDYALGLDTNQNNQITWNELRAQHRAIASYALSHLQLSVGDSLCPTTAAAHLVDHHSDGAYAVLRFTATCPVRVTALTIDYRLFFDLDPQHKGLLRLDSPAGQRTAVVDSDRPRQSFALKHRGWLVEFGQYLKLGIWHIWSGFDHLLFLFSLLLPAVLRRRNKQWAASPDLRASLWDVAKVISAFTLAHSVTLILAALGFVTIPTRLVESTIAASVVLAACNNLYPFVLERRWMLAFTFGLIQGFGFASVLSDLNLEPGTLLTK